MRIGIVSDTHGGLPRGVLEVFEDCEHIIHAGDVGIGTVIEEFETVAPVTAVLGNCDYRRDGLECDPFVYTRIGTTLFFITHRPKDVEDALRGWGGIPYGQSLPTVCVHGHTHISRQELIGPVLMLCPGSASEPRGGSDSSVMLLEVEGGCVSSVELVSLL